MKKSFLKTKTVHGIKTGNHSNPNVLRAARASGGSCMVAEGESTRPPMSKAPRMRRADGGGVKISEDSKAKAAELRKGASEDRDAGGKAIGTGLAVGLAGAGLKRLGLKAAMDNAARADYGRKAPQRMYGAGTAGVGAGTGMAGYGLLKNAGAAARENEADSIERGEAVPGKEDRKNGGGVFPRLKPKTVPFVKRAVDKGNK